MKAHEEMIADWMKDPEFKAEYDALEEEFSIFDALVEARQKAGLTQEEVARRWERNPRPSPVWILRRAEKTVANAEYFAKIRQGPGVPAGTAIGSQEKRSRRSLRRLPWGFLDSNDILSSVMWPCGRRTGCSPAASYPQPRQ